MPQAHQGEVKYSYRDSDSAIIDLAPPVLNQWYTVLNIEDVRLIMCDIRQTNNEAAGKEVEVRWTIDGTIYLGTQTLVNNTIYYVARNTLASSGGTTGLTISLSEWNAGFRVDKRGQSFKVEARITSALGTNQTLRCRCSYETLEQT